MIPASHDFLRTARDLADNYGSLLVFDEVATDRVAKEVHKKFTTRPDLTLLGKIIGGGLPVGAVGGKTELMDMLAPVGPVYQAGTLSGNPISMSAGIATLSELKSDDFYITLNRFTKKLTSGFQETANRNNVPLVCNHVVCLVYFFRKNQTFLA